MSLRSVAIVAIVVLNAAVGFVQEYRAERAMAALKAMAAPTATVLRAGMIVVVPAIELVPGDVVLLEAGRVVPADLRLLEAARLRVEEAALTGESVPVEKATALLSGDALPVGDRTNMAYKGTIATYGRGRGVVVATGMDTEFGKIAASLQAAEEVKTPLQRRLGRFGQSLSFAVLAICVVVFATGLARGEPPLAIFLVAVSLAVAAIPEALPAVVTISLALGARKMVARNALVRRLPAVETLGSVTYICSDKTGTLTMNRMRVEELYCDGEARQIPGGGGAWAELLLAMALSNDAGHGPTGTVLGDPTEVALMMAAQDAGVEKATQLGRDGNGQAAARMRRAGELEILDSVEGDAEALARADLDAADDLRPLILVFQHEHVLQAEGEVDGRRERLGALAGRASGDKDDPLLRQEGQRRERRPRHRRRADEGDDSQQNELDRVGGWAAHRRPLLHRGSHAHLTAPLELECHGNRVARLEVAREAQQHDVIAARFQLHLAAGRDRELLDGTHLHHAPFLLDLVQLDSLGRIARRGDERVAPAPAGSAAPPTRRLDRSLAPQRKRMSILLLSPPSRRRPPERFAIRRSLRVTAAARPSGALSASRGW